MNDDIFISYSHIDKERIRPLVSLFERQGWAVWWDESGITKGKGFRPAIDNALKTVKCVVVVWSKHSVGRDFVLDEADVGRQRGVLVPIIIDDVDIPLGLRQTQHTKFTHWPPSSGDPELGRLLHAIADLIRKPLHVPEPELQREDVSFDKLSKAGKTETNEIMQRCKSMIATNPEDGEAHSSLALCYLHLKHYKLAIEHFKRAVELLPSDPDAYYYYGLSLISGRRPMSLSLNDVRRIEEILETAIQLDDRPAKYYCLAAIIKADYYLANGLRSTPPSPEELISMARRRDHDPGEVERLLQAITLRDEKLISRIRGR
jgi:hypothetical protein